MDAPTQAQGSYFDGVTGVPQSVRLTLEEKAIAIESTDGVPLAHWDYSAIQHWPSRRERLRLGLANSPLTARLEVLDPACAEVIKSRLGFGISQEELDERRRRHRVVEWTIAAVVAVVVIGVAGMPTFARLLLPLIPRSAEVRIGLEAHLEAKRSFDEKDERFECGDAARRKEPARPFFCKCSAAWNKPRLCRSPCTPTSSGRTRSMRARFPADTCTSTWV